MSGWEGLSWSFRLVAGLQRPGLPKKCLQRFLSPYFYCPMDEDGFGEEEEYEVAVTCHIDIEGHLADTPVWKPYTGPRR